MCKENIKLLSFTVKMLFIICDTSQESNTRHADQSDQKQNVRKKLKASSFLDLSNYFSKYA